MCSAGCGDNRWFIALAVLLAGCGLDGNADLVASGDDGVEDFRGRSDAGDAAPPEGRADGSAETDARADLGQPDGTGDVAVEPDAAQGGEPLVVDATFASVSADFTANISGTVGAPLGEAVLTDNVGYVVVDGEQLPTFGYRRQEWNEFGLVLVQSLAVREDAIFPLWFYCTGSQLDGVYVQGTDGMPSTWIPASSGTCDIESAPATTAVELPDLRLPHPAPDHAFEVTGELNISPGENGTFTSDGRDWQVFGFETIDCTMECGMPGWWELHAILWEEVTRELCFSIFYLFEGDREMSVSYSICLPSLTDIITDRIVSGDWSR